MIRPLRHLASVEFECGRCQCWTVWTPTQLGDAALRDLRCPVCGVIGWMHIDHAYLVEKAGTTMRVGGNL